MSDSFHPAEEGPLSEALGVLRKRWKSALATFLGFVVVAALVSYRLPLVYQAQARIVVGASQSGGLGLDASSALESYFMERRSFETQVEVLRSEPVALIAAESLGWIDDESSASERERRAAQVKGAIDVVHLRDTRIVDLRARDGSPERAQAMANAVAEAYIEYTAIQGDRARNRSVAWLADEIDGLRGKLRSSEERLLDYLSTERIPVESAAAGDGGGGGGDPAERAQLAAAEAELTQLLGRYRNLHPKVQESRKRVAGLRARANRNQASQAVESRKLIQYRLLKRDAELDQEMYEILLKKLKEADISREIAGGHIRILERAKRPMVPIAPRIARNLIIAVVLAFCLAIGVAALFEMLDRSITTADDVARTLGLPTLGIVGEFPKRRLEGLPVNVLGASISEMFRAVRTNLRFSHVDQPRRVVLVTSTGPEEGKSTLVANLGASIAQSGRRTLVIDTDLRRPSLHRTLRVPRTPGLANVLAGDMTLENAIRETETPGLDVLVCGTVPANPSELIESARLGAMIQSLRECYDYVILDSPPAGALVDASLLSAHADGVVFVVEPRRYDLRVLKRSLAQLDRAGARLYGVVLNKTDEPDHGYLYGYYGERPAEAAVAGASGA